MYFMHIYIYAYLCLSLNLYVFIYIYICTYVDTCMYFYVYIIYRYTIRWFSSTHGGFCDRFARNWGPSTRKIAKRAAPGGDFFFTAYTWALHTPSKTNSLRAPNSRWLSFWEGSMCGCKWIEMATTCNNSWHMVRMLHAHNGHAAHWCGEFTDEVFLWKIVAYFIYSILSNSMYQFSRTPPTPPPN